MAGSYKILGPVMKFLHLLQILEIIHPLLSYTGGDWRYPALHVGYKLFMIFMMIDAEPRMQVKPVVFYLFLLYTMVEVAK